MTGISGCEQGTGRMPCSGSCRGRICTCSSSALYACTASSTHCAASACSKDSKLFVHDSNSHFQLGASAGVWTK